MVDPIGPLLTNFDAIILGGQNAIVTAVQENIELPAVCMAVWFYVMQGIEVANGNREPLDRFIPQLLRVLTVLWLSCNIADYDYYVHQMLYVGLPNKLVQVAAGAGGTLAAVNLADMTATAAVFSQLWNQMWVAIGMAWAHAGVGDMVGVFLGGMATAAAGGLGLLILGLIFLCSHILLAVMDDITPFLIVFAMFKTTTPIFERAVGKAFALILLQFVGVIVLQVVLTADQAFMQQIVASATGRPTGITSALEALNSFLALPFGPQAPTANQNLMANDMQALVSIVVMFIAGGFAMLSVSAIAYSIGTGISVSATSMFMGAAAAAAATEKIVEAVRELGTRLGAGGGAAGPSLGLRMAEGSPAALPSVPPPPALSQSTRPTGQQFRAA